MNNKKYMVLFVLLFVTLLSCAVITAADTTNNVTAEKTVSKDTTTQKAVQTDKNVKNINTEKTNTIEKKVINNKKEAVTEVEAPDYVTLETLVNQAKTSDDEYIIKYTGIDAGSGGIINPLKWDSTTPKSLTINGNGAILDMEGNRFITITEGNELTLANITLKNSVSTDKGGSIINHGTLTVLDSTFENNEAKNFGGAIFSDGTLTLNRSKFTNNFISTENAYTNSLGGGAIASSGSLVVDESVFTGNYAKHTDVEPDGNGGYAGAIYVLNTTADVTITNSNFTSNHARHGGVICVLDKDHRNEGIVTIEGNKFYQNSALYGAAINSFHDTIIKGNNFTENKVSGEGSPDTSGNPRQAMGGALCLQSDGGETHTISYDINNNNFTDNEAQGNGYGGAIFIDSSGGVELTVESTNNIYQGNKALRASAVWNPCTATFTNDKFIKNIASEWGTVYNNGNTTCINDEFIENECEKWTGVFVHYGDKLIADGCVFTDNVGAAFGDLAFVASGKEIAISNSEINTQKDIGNLVSGKGKGTDVTINGMLFSETDFTTPVVNPITNVSNYQELVDLVNAVKTNAVTYDITANLTGTEYIETEPIVIDSTFKPELLTINGNGQSIDAVGKQFLTIAQGKAVTINNLTVKNANAVNGAAVYNNGTLTVENSVFKDNTASYYGGAIYSHKNVGAKLTVNNTEFLDNKANVGGAIFANLGSTLKIDETNFTGNRAINASTTGDGGAIYVNNATVSIFNTNFKQNYANVTGGAIGAINSTQFEVFNTNFTNNEAYYGGAVYSNLTLNMDKVLFESNTARGEGAAIFTSYGKLTVNDAIFDSNIASTRGGAISNAEGTLNLLNSKFINNQAQNGGAIYNTFKGLNPIATISIINDTFTSNKAQADGEYTICSGGAIWTNLPLSVKGSNFTDNSAREGGAIYTDFALDAYNINVDESKFTSNTATKNGGAIYTSYPTAITNSNFKSNAAADGSAIYVCPDSMSFMHEDIYADVSIESSIFDSNVASENGTLYVDENTQLSAKDSTFTDNQATTGSVVYQSGTTTLDTCTINDNPVSEDGYLIANDEATSLTLKDNTISHNGADLVNTDVQTKTAEGNTFAQGNVIVEIAPISDVTIIDTEETTNIPVTLTIDEIYGITSIDDAHIKVTVNEDVQNAYSFPVSGTGSTIAIPVSDLSANNAVVVELVSDSGIYTLTPESLSFSIQKLITTQLSVNAANIYAGDNVNISGTLQKGDTGIAQKTIKLVINDVEYTTTTDDNGYFKFTDLIINDVTSEVVVSAKFVETGYIESSATDSFAVLERPSIVSTSITVDAIEGDLHVDDKVTLTSYVKDDLGNFVDGGFVIFKINGKTLRDDAGKVIYVQVDNGKVQLPDVAVTQEWAKEGSKIQAYYTGTDGYDISVSAPVSVSVVKHTAVVDVSDISGVAGQDITIKATVTSNGAPVPVGRVAIKIDGKTLKDADGKALYVSVAEIAEGVTYKLPAKIKAGTHTLSVVFTDPTFDRATDSATLTVSKEQT